MLCVYVYVEARGQSLVSCLVYCLLCFSELGSLLAEAPQTSCIGWPANHRDPPVSVSACLSYMQHCFWPFLWIPEMEHRPSCLFHKYFTDWAVTQVPAGSTEFLISKTVCFWACVFCPDDSDCNVRCERHQVCDLTFVVLFGSSGVMYLFHLYLKGKNSAQKSQEVKSLRIYIFNLSVFFYLVIW